MEKLRRNNVLSLVMNVLIVIFTIQCFVDAFRLDVVPDPEWIDFRGIHCLRFFTVLSNLFVGVVSGIMFVWNIKNLMQDKNDYPEWLIVLKHTATTCVGVTFATVLFLLAPGHAILGKGFINLYFGSNFYMHLVTPILAMVSFVCFECSQVVSFKKTLWTLVPMVLYSILYCTMVVIIGEQNGGWPDFYNFTFGGHNWMIPFSAIGMLIVTLGISVLLAKLHNINYKKLKNCDEDTKK